MNKGRKPGKAAESTLPESAIDSDRLDSDLRNVDADSRRLAIIDKRYGTRDGEIVVYQRERVIDEVRFYMGQSSQALLEMGRRLLLIKEHEPHGDWLECLQRIGIEESVARRAMQASLKFGVSNRATSHDLSKSKLIELMTLDDSEIAELNEGGTVAGLTMDRIERMSVRELRAALRAANETSDAKDRLIAEKNEKLDELRSEALSSRAWDAVANALIGESDALFVIVQEHLARLIVVQRAMMNADFGAKADTEAALSACAVAFGDKLTRTSQMLSELRGTHDKTLGGFAERLDAQPLDYDGERRTEVIPAPGGKRRGPASAA